MKTLELPRMHSVAISSGMTAPAAPSLKSRSTRAVHYVRAENAGVARRVVEDIASLWPASAHHRLEDGGRRKGSLTALDR